LIALDETKSADEIIDLVKEHNWGQSVTFKLISVLRNPHQGILPASPALDEYYEDSVRLCSANMRTLATKLKKQYANAEVLEEILNGDPKQIIVEDARLWGADLIVLGCRYRNPLKRAVVGSVSLAVLSTAPCSVLLLRQAGECGRSRKIEGDLAQQETAFSGVELLS
ncbi:MAG: universal stress protein, partial [Candidatus Obscuribacterales bacterium]|nr:universal stress protein [Candidatus Obscuribacterales bacterium]